MIRFYLSFVPRFKPLDTFVCFVGGFGFGYIKRLRLILGFLEGFGIEQDRPGKLLGG
jgi:hypothetical protein